jgi:hypothetical protein
MAHKVYRLRRRFDKGTAKPYNAGEKQQATRMAAASREIGEKEECE